MKKAEIMVENKKMQILFEFDDSVYGKVKRCRCNENIVYVINNNILEDKEIFNELEIKYGFIIPDDKKNIIY